MSREIAVNRCNENRHPTSSLLADWLNTDMCTFGLFHQDRTTHANLCPRCFSNISTPERPHFDIIIQYALRIGSDLSFIVCDSCSQLLEEVQTCGDCEACLRSLDEIWINFIEFLFNYGDTTTPITTLNPQQFLFLTN